MAKPAYVTALCVLRHNALQTPTILRMGSRVYEAVAMVAVETGADVAIWQPGPKRGARRNG